jgi:hypothetical protein
VTAQQLAERLNARPAGRGRWQALCPGHDDRSPSLSIRAGQQGRPLIHCFAGCELKDILVAAGLCIADLFPGPPPSPEKMRELARERRILEEFERKRAAEQRAVNEQYRKLYAVCDALGEKMAHMPDGASRYAVATLFHSTLEKLRSVEERFEAEENRKFHERLMRKKAAEVGS